MAYNAEDDVQLPRIKIINAGIWAESTFGKMIQRYGIPKMPNGYPVLLICKALQKRIHELLTQINVLEQKMNLRVAKANIKIDDPEADLERAKKYEEVQKLRILNQTKMGALISRDRAKARSITLLSAFATKMRYTIKHTSAQVAGMADAREVEKILTNNYNAVIDTLEREAKLISWSEDGLSSELGRTQLSEDSGQDTSGGSGQEDKTTAEV